MLEEDLDEVMRVEQAAYDYPWTRKIMLDCICVGCDCWLIDDGDGVIAGHAILSTGAGEAHVLNMCVHPDYQGNSLGRRLMQKLVDVARWNRVTSIFLEVRVSNWVASRFYESVGFNEVGIRKDYYPANEGREDALIMAYEISALSFDKPEITNTSS